MRFLNFFKSNKDEQIKPIINSIGKFLFTEFDGTKNYKGIINSIIGQNIELLFPVIQSQISNYQVDYFKKIENNWTSILQQLKNLKPEIDFENYNVVNIMIPEKGNEFYDVDAEIVFKKKGNIISAILIDLNVDEIIEN
ncbi:MAG TPA: hypothetical protein PLL09_07395 [Flavobacterium sp.]|uniref:hypothetical protein n=1 Tax=unclassified Flavobacterium TaxID=196869 RepID=UPI0025BE0F71|nr:MULTISPECIES: hypothetical protein [unclassified Flavobacterium]HRE77633.1 hypothetical protein [Flavobacterium sp.]